MLSHLYNIDASIEKIRKRKDFLSDIFEPNGIISYFRSRTRYIVSYSISTPDLIPADLYAPEKSSCHAHLELTSRKDQKVLKKYVICLPRDSDPNKVPSIDYALRHLLAALVKKRSVQELSNSRLHLKGQCHAIS